MNKKDCPSQNELNSYLVGELDPGEIDRVASHVDECTPCEDTVAALDDNSDTLLSGLRSPQRSQYASDDEYLRALEFVKQFGREISQAHPKVSSDEAPALPRSNLREYALLEKLGEGGMGAVYRARHTKLDKIVALKVLPPERMKDRDAVARFEREMRAVGRLDHPNIVRAMDAGEVAGTHFLVMEYVDGVDLSELVKQVGPLPIAEACELIRQAAVGLDEAHDNSMVHRDIKPSNLILARHRRKPPTVKILDMGLAMLSEAHAPDAQGLTSTGQMMGTLDFMAPEQGGDTKNVDVRADIYALGASLYKLLCGEAIYSGARYQSPVQKMMALATEPAPPIQQRREGISGDLAAVVHRMLEKSPADRFATPDEVAAALEPFCAGADLKNLLDDVESHGSMTEDAATSPTAPGTSSPLEDTDETLDHPSARIMPEVHVPDPSSVSQPSATSQPKSSAAASGRKQPPTSAIALGAIALSGVAVLLSVFFFRTGKGTLRVEINDPNVKVQVQGTDIVLSREGEEDIELKPGDKKLIVTRGDLKFETTAFKIEKGENPLVKVEMLSDKLRVVRGDDVLGEKSIAEASTKPDTPAPVALAWAPTEEQQAFVDAVKRLPAEDRWKTITKKMQEIAFARIEVSLDDSRHVTIKGGACNQIWPIVAIDGIESIDFVGSGVLDFRPLQATKVKSVNVQLAAYNTRNEAMLKGIRSLARINDVPAEEYYAKREAIRKKIDDMAKAAPNLGTADVIKMVTPLLEELNPDGVSLRSGGVSGHNVIGYSKRGDGFYLHARLCGGLRDLSPLRVLPFTQLDLSGTQVFDLSPLEGLPLTTVSIQKSAVSDLSPLAGMPLTQLGLSSCQVSDLGPLAGTKLQAFACQACPVSDLSPLAGMPLESLNINGTPVQDLSPLKGMKLTSFVSGGAVRDISVLAGMPISHLAIEHSKQPHDTYRWFRWGPGYGPIDDLSPLKGMPLKSLSITYKPEIRELLESLKPESINGMPAARFWVTIRKQEDGFRFTGLPDELKSKSGLKFTPADERQNFFDAIKNFPPKARQNAIVSKIAELANHGVEVARSARFAVELTPQGDAPTECIIDAWTVHQIWPLTGLKTLEKVDLVGSSVTDFRPLAELPLRELDAEVVLYNTAAEEVFRDISTLKTINGQPKDEFLAKREKLRNEIDAFQKTAKLLKPQEIFSWVVPRLKELNPDFPDPKFVAAGIQPGDSRISLANGLLKIWRGAGLRDLSPLRVLSFDRVQISSHNNLCGGNLYDLSSLRGLPLKSIRIGGCSLADLRPLQGMPLEELEVSLTAVSDLSPLKNLPLASIGVQGTFVTDFSPLKVIKTLKTINGKSTVEVLGD